MDFRAFLHRHAELLRALPEWELRLLVPRHLAEAAPLFEAAAREELAAPLAARRRRRTALVLQAAATGSSEVARPRTSGAFRPCAVGVSARLGSARCIGSGRRRATRLLNAHGVARARATRSRDGTGPRDERRCCLTSMHHLSPLVGTA